MCMLCVHTYIPVGKKTMSSINYLLTVQHCSNFPYTCQALCGHVSCCLATNASLVYVSLTQAPVLTSYQWEVQGLCTRVEVGRGEEGMERNQLAQL